MMDKTEFFTFDFCSFEKSQQKLQSEFSIRVAKGCIYWGWAGSKWPPVYQEVQYFLVKVGAGSKWPPIHEVQEQLHEKQSTPGRDPTAGFSGLIVVGTLLTSGALSDSVPNDKKYYHTS